MQKKTFLTIILTIIIFLSACTLGISTVYRVNDVTVCAETLSSEAELEAVELKHRLSQAYQKKSMFSLDETIAESVLAEFPYFRILSIEKAFPNRLVFHVSEDEEVYALPTPSADGYYILNADGTILSVREHYVNRKETDENAKNVLIEGLSVGGEKGTKIAGDDALEYLLAFCQRVSHVLGGIRRNVVSVTLMKGGSSVTTHVLKMEMIEGIFIYVRNPGALTLEKAEKAIAEYMRLPDGAHTKGMIVVYEKDGEVVTMYSPTDDFSE